MASHSLLRVYQFFKAGNTNITAEMVGEVVGLVESEMGSLEDGDEKQQIGQHFTNSLLHMRLRRDAESSSLYQGLKL